MSSSELDPEDTRTLDGLGPLRRQGGEPKVFANQQQSGPAFRAYYPTFTPASNPISIDNSPHMGSGATTGVASGLTHPLLSSVAVPAPLNNRGSGVLRQHTSSFPVNATVRLPAHGLAYGADACVRQQMAPGGFQAPSVTPTEAHSGGSPSFNAAIPLPDVQRRPLVVIHDGGYVV